MIKKLKNKGFDDQYVIDRLLELDFRKEDVLEELKEREYRIEAGKTARIFEGYRTYKRF